MYNHNNMSAISGHPYLACGLYHVRQNHVGTRLFQIPTYTLLTSSKLNMTGVVDRELIRTLMEVQYNIEYGLRRERSECKCTYVTEFTVRYGGNLLEQI